MIAPSLLRSLVFALCLSSGAFPRAVPVESDSTDVLNAFEQWSRDYTNAPVKSDSLIQKGVALAQQRRTVLARLIESDPEAALHFSLSAALRQQLPASILPYLEQLVDGIGRYEVVGIFPDTRLDCRIERFVTLNGQTYRAFVYGQRLVQTCTDNTVLSGVAIAGTLALADLPKTAARAITSTVVDKSWTRGEKSLLLMRVAFPDAPAESISADDALALFAKVNAFLSDNSFGALSLRTTVTPLLLLPRSKQWYQGLEIGIRLAMLLADARDLAAGVGYASASFDLDFVHTVGKVIGPRAYVGVKGGALCDASAGNAAHEIGHNLSLFHAEAWETTNGTIIGPGVTREYGDAFDTMGGYTDSLWHFNVYEKLHLNWISTSTVQRAESDGVYRLHPLDVPLLDQSSAYALRIYRDSQRDYWIETRRNLTTNSETAGVLLHWNPWGGSLGGTQLLDTIPQGHGGFFDAPLRLGRAFYDSGPGLKIVPQNVDTNEPPSVDLLIRHVKYFAAEAKEEQRAAAGTSFDFNFRTSGTFFIWTHARGSGRLAISLDEAEPSMSFSLTTSGNAWEWLPVWQNTLVTLPARIALDSGPHTLKLSSDDKVEVDCLLLTDDPDTVLPPVISPISAQSIRVGTSITIPFAAFEIGSWFALRFEATSSYQSVVRNNQISVTGDDVHHTVTLTPSPDVRGSTLITLSAISTDGTFASTEFAISVQGDVEALIQAASPGDIVQIPSGTYTGNIRVNKDVFIEGSSSLTTILTGGSNRAGFLIESNRTVTLRNLSVRSGRIGIQNYGRLHLVSCAIENNAGASQGAGIWNATGAALTLDRCTVSSNASVIYGGGLYNEGTALLLNCTFSGNSSDLGQGGALFNRGHLTAQHCTIAFNRAVAGGGIANLGGIDIENTIIARNISTAQDGSDLYGTFPSIRYSLIERSDGFLIYPTNVANLRGTSPQLAGLELNGGQTKTHALLPGSPGIDAASINAISWDQRGIARSVDRSALGYVTGPPDIGSFEAFSEAPTSFGLLSICYELPDGPTIRLIGADAETWRIEKSSDLRAWHRITALPPVSLLSEYIDLESPASPLQFYRAVRLDRY